ncbi:hypothetical protein ATE92_1468 [Ulvibacter sp. MAR_2010_11]|uniref:hypothetical protein n=1 Tax=Ulvibacter sp. MAR_2010_11 TaxID=1250229 RepID=UPI000C2B9EAD|nr:hypothetical protein [Ulvibacter sp. MAR_2010_11]PKA83316.1 hypothetical protein ATE92_1468 [Ulvibacter sp. MAR_2010_11]
MKKIALITLTALFIGASFTSCREQKSEKETLIEEMQEDGADIKVKTDGDETKIKMETDDKSVKIKEEDGESKMKVKTDNDDN